MLMNEIPVKQEDGYITKLYPYYTTTKPCGSILILHGLVEHHNRYINFAEFLNRCGFDVFLYDHRGHGTDKKLEELGCFSEKGGDRIIIKDVIHLIHFIRKNSRSKRLFVFAHSMGSIIMRNVIQHLDSIDGVILSGTNFTPELTAKVGLLISSVIRKAKGPLYQSEFLNNLLFNEKRYGKICERTKFDWLTRNNYIVGQYMHDPYCGYVCTTSLYNDFLRLINNSVSPLYIKRTRRDLPIFIISGKDDPVGGYGQEIFRYVSVLQKLEFSEVECTLYADCRHELLNELNNKEVMQDIVKWIKKTLASFEENTPAVETPANE